MVLVGFLGRRVRVLVRLRDLRRRVTVGLGGPLRRCALGLGTQSLGLATSRGDRRGGLLVSVGSNRRSLTLQCGRLVLSLLNDRLSLRLSNLTFLGSLTLKSVSLAAGRRERLLGFSLETLRLYVGGSNGALRLTAGGVDKFGRFALCGDSQLGDFTLNGGAQRVGLTFSACALLRNFRVDLGGDALRLARSLRDEFLGLTLGRLAGEERRSLSCSLNFLCLAAALREDLRHFVVCTRSQLLGGNIGACDCVLRVRVRTVHDIGGLLLSGAQEVLNARAETLVRGLVGLGGVLLKFIKALIRLCGLGTRLLGFLLRGCERFLKPHQMS